MTQSILQTLAPSAVHAALHSATPHFLLRVPPGLADKLAEKLAADSRIEFVEPNRLREPLAISNDPGAGYEWGLTVVNAARAWSFAPGRFATAASPIPQRALIAVVDTGVDCTHPDFANTGGTSKDAAGGGQLSFAKSVAYVTTTVSPAACAWQDDYGHGTHVAGTIAAATSNGIGAAGLAYGAMIGAYKTSNSAGMSSDYAISQAIMAAADNGAKVISISLGAPGYSQTMQDAINYAWQHNSVVVAAAGNLNSSAVFFPGNATHAIAVAAVDSTRARANFSNYGNFIGIAAPGVSIYSTVPTYSNTMGILNYASMSGTSMATPHVSAAAGLVAMAYPGASATAIAARLQQTASNSNSGGGWNQYLGYGVLDAGAATAGSIRPATVGSIAGQVTDSHKYPVSGAIVSAGGVSFTTGASGLFRLANLPAGAQNVTVSATGYPMASFTATVPAGADVVVPVRMGATMGSYTGYVSAGGAPLAGAAVEAISGGLVQASVTTAPDGSFSLPVLAGAYDVRASGLGYISQTVTGVAAGAAGPAGLSFTLHALGTISGTVADPTGAALANVQVLFSSATYAGGAVTDANGNFTSLGLPTGSYTVTAQAAGFADAVRAGVDVAQDGAATVSLQFAAGVASVTLSSASMTGPATLSNNSVKLNTPAPDGGAVVALSSSSPSVVVPATVTIPARATSAAFGITASGVSASTPVVITASWNSSTRSANLTVLPPVLSFMYVQVAPVQPGGTTTVTAYLTGAAPAGDATIVLNSSSASVTVPASAVVPAGRTTAAFTVAVASNAPSGAVTISGTYGGATKTGTLNVGAAGVSGVTMSPASMVGGSSSTASSVALAGPAPTGGAVVTLTSSDPSVTVAASVTVPAGATSATFAVSTASVTAATTATITASYNGTAKTATLTVTPLALSAISLNPASLAGGASTTGTVSLTGPAPDGGAVVTLASSDPSVAVPASVTIAAGTASATFAVATAEVAASTTVTVTAAYGGVSKAATLTVCASAALSGIAVNPASIAAGTSSTANTVILTAVAPAAGAVVTLVSSDPAVAVPATVTVPGGAMSATFAISTSNVAAQTPVTITATYGAVSKAAPLTVIPSAALSAIYVATPLAAGTSSGANTVSLTAAAPAGGAIVALASSDPNVSVPASVTIPAGATSAAFMTAAGNVTTTTNLVITASYSGASISAPLSVQPALGRPVSGVYMNPASVTGGNSGLFNNVWIASAAPAGGVVVSLSSSDPAAVVPATVTIPAGANYTTFTITTSLVSVNTPVTISATSGGVTKTAALTVLPTAVSSIFVWGAAGGQASPSNTVYLTGPAPAGGAVVSFTSSDPSVSVSPTVTVPPGATNARFAIVPPIVSVTTNYTITATYGGVAKTATLTVNPPALSLVYLVPATMTGGASTTSNTIYLTGPAPAGGVAVSLTASDPTVTVPASVTVPAGATTATFPISAAAVGSPLTTTITGTFGGVVKTATLTVNPPAVSSVTLSPATLRGGSTGSAGIYLSGPAPAGGSVVTLSSASNAAIVPPTVLVPAGSTYVSVPIATASVLVNTPATIAAAAFGAPKTNTVTVTP